MARVIEWATGDVPASERRFLEIVRRDLPEDWTVAHGLRVRSPPADRELDFLVLGRHPYVAATRARALLIVLEENRAAA